MKTRKERVTVTVDPALVEAGAEAIAAGHAESLSAWVNLALAERVAKERRLRALGDAIAAYEAEFGRIADDELTAQERIDRRSARVIRGAAPSPSKKRRRARARRLA
jgi:hypothetical protein